MTLRKNVAGQVIPFAMVTTAGAAGTGLTVTARVTLDGAAQAAGGGTVTELANGQYKYVPTQAETNVAALGLLLTASGCVPQHFTIYPTAADPTDAVRLGLSALPNVAAGAAGGVPVGDASGRVDVSKIGGTTQTARDLGASVLVSPGTGTGQLSIASGVIKADLSHVLGSGLTEGGAGRLAAALVRLLDVAAPVLTAASVNQTGDSYARIGNAGAGLTALVTDTAAAVLSEVVGSGYSVAEALRIWLAVLSGPSIVNPTTGAVTFRDPADTKDVVTLIGDADGNRSAIVIDATA